MKTVLNVKTDKEIKEKAQEIAKEMGVPLSVVVNAYLKNFIRERTFTVSIEPQVKSQVWEEMDQAFKDYKKGINISPKFSDARDILQWLKR